jgi:hypothetical protein
MGGAVKAGQQLVLPAADVRQVARVPGDRGRPAAAWLRCSTPWTAAMQVIAWEIRRDSQWSSAIFLARFPI